MIYASITQIQRVTALVLGCDFRDMTSVNKSRAAARPRQVAMYLAREITGRSLPAIGRAFGQRDHSTVYYACNAIRNLIVPRPAGLGPRDRYLARQVEEVRLRLASADLEAIPEQAEAALRSAFDQLERRLSVAAREHPAEFMRGLAELAAALGERKT